MNVPLWVVPAVGVLFHILPKALNVAFPRGEDGRIAERARVALRKNFDQYLDQKDETLQRFIRVIFPDNMGVSAAVLAYYIASNKYPVTEADLPLLLTTFLTITVASHLLRESSHRFIVPMVKEFPKVGATMARLINYVSPSDLSQRDV